MQPLPGDISSGVASTQGQQMEPGILCQPAPSGVGSGPERGRARRWVGGGGGAAQLLTVSYDGSLRRLNPGAGAAFALLRSDEHAGAAGRTPRSRPCPRFPARPWWLLRAQSGRAGR